MGFTGQKLQVSGYGVSVSVMVKESSEVSHLMMFLKCIKNKILH